ncbi:ankyrin repeat domain-containing protein [Danxiaibacter flavus]|uniref:Ankyrin repeat domain-containing protein n=1 Tax=Danxiaibacter flavus TaxID=3049108 RepID=A0ABV3ZDN9_9BACT|nr:ankyrin repeat domain-containing protein [Chitinophagaceae bacterium DXS]
MNILIALSCLLFIHSCEKKNEKTSMEDHQSIIINAVKKGQLQLVEKELGNGADVNTTDEHKSSLLLIATHDNDLEMAKLLVKHGADVNQQDEIYDSPFLYAGASGYAELVTLFLANGARFDVFNRYNGSALIPACERGHLEVVKILANTKGFPIDHINRLGWTGLLEAVILGNGSSKYVDVVRILVSAGCNVNIADHNGVTALQHAKASGYKDIAAILEKAK